MLERAFKSYENRVIRLHDKIKVRLIMQSEIRCIEIGTERLFYVGGPGASIYWINLTYKLKRN